MFFLGIKFISASLVVDLLVNIPAKLFFNSDRWFHEKMFFYIWETCHTTGGHVFLTDKNPLATFVGHPLTISTKLWV